MTNRLVALDKIPGVRPVDIREIWKRMTANVVLEVTGGEAKSACGKAQLFAGLEAGIDGVVHAVKSW